MAPHQQRKGALGVRKSLIIGFGSIGIILSVALFIAYKANVYVDASLKAITSETIPKLSAAYEVSLEVSSIARSLRDAILVETQEDLPTELGRAKAAQEKITALMKQLDAAVTSSKEKELLASLHEAEAAYRKDREQFVYHVEGGARGPARGMLTGQLRKSQANYLAALDAFRTDQTARLQTSADAAAVAMDQMQLRLLVSFACVGIAAGAVAFLLLRLLHSRLGCEPHQLAEAMQNVAQGDLSVPLDRLVAPKGSVIDSLRQMVEALARSVSEVRLSSNSVARQSEALVQESKDLALRTEQQSAELEQAAAALDQFAATMGQSLQTVSSADALARSSDAMAARSEEIVGEAVKRMDSVSECGVKIAETTTLIDNISFQTNILALNAAVEAAHAGNQGQGFAVVAGEVRNLATHSASSAKHVRQMITDSNEQIAECRKMIALAQSESSSVRQSVRDFGVFMQKVQTASSEQNIGVAQISEALSRIDQFTQRNAALVNQARATSEQLQSQSARMEAAVSHFRLVSEPA